MDINRDNWGNRARIGMFIVGSEAVPEAEWWAMMPADISVHTARVTARAPWANWDSEHHDLELSEDLSRGLKQFASMKLDAIVIGHSSSSFIGGRGWDEAIIEQLSAGLDDTVAVTTNGLDIFAAINEMKLQILCLFPVQFQPAVSAGGNAGDDHGCAMHAVANLPRCDRDGNPHDGVAGQHAGPGGRF